MGVDEELSQLEEAMRRLKVEYDVYFGGGSKKPPADTQWRVESLLKKYSDGHKMNFAQRFKYNSLQQKHSLFNGLWQQKLKIKEEGYRRPQDAVLGISGMRISEEQDAAAALSKKGKVAEETGTFKTHFSDVNADHENVERLFNAMMSAKTKAGENANASFDSFKTFVQKKTEQIRKDYGCHAVEYSVELENGQVRLKAKAKI
ncbi:MAG TPA: MXAN_5187 C-terminal domain-containing protein [Terriglobales bacterium]|nr:MXAN_5187 C-terminal domain-containing protein [Terriglobales bacterium]